MEKSRSEHGQVLVLILLTIVALIGFAALAVDLGVIYSVRRQAQNAADSAALSMAFTVVNGSGNPVTAAMAKLAQNGFGDDTDPGVNADKDIDVQLWNPPLNGPYAAVSNKNEYYQVIVSSRVKKIFAQFVFQGEERVTVEAVAHSSAPDSMSPGLALHATGRDHCPGIVFNGGSNTNITGGGILSNSKANGTSGSCASGIMTGSSGNIGVTGGDIGMAGSWIANAGVSISPAVKTFVDPSYPNVPEPPDCSSLPSRTASSSPLLPGRYSGSIAIQNGTWVMNPGLYCVDGNFSVNGGSLTGNGVVIYMTAAGGGVNFSGSAMVSLSTGGTILDSAGRNYGGFLIYMNPSNHNGVDMAGSNGTYYHGTIYAPGYRDPDSQEKCNIGGSNSSMALRSNIICYSIGIAGNSSVTITYKPEENFRNPPIVELTQ